MVQYQNQQFSSAVDFTYIFNSYEGRLGQIWVNFNTAPTTSENIIISFVDGQSNVETEIKLVDPSTGGETDVFVGNEFNILLIKNDQLKIAYPNTDSRTVDVGIRVEDRIK